MRITQLTRDDAAAYQDLRLYSLQESPEAFGSSFDEEVNRPLEIVANRIKDPANHVFGAFSEEDQLIGMVTLRWEQREKSIHKAAIYAMFVSPQYRGKGTGRALMDTAIQRARDIGVRQVILAVNNSNKAAVHLYEACGFERFGLETDSFLVGGKYYDAVYMTLPLEGGKPARDSLFAELIDLENKGWLALSKGADAALEFYDKVLDEEVIMLFPGDMYLSDRDEILRLMDSPPWEWYRIEPPVAQALGDRAGLLVYRVEAQRPGDEIYKALVCSVYVRRGERWKMTFHQQTV